MKVRSEDIYEALFDDNAFANLPNLLAHAAGGRSALILWRAREGEYDALAYNHFSAEWIRQYTDNWTARDPWAGAALHPERLNTFMLCQQYVPESAWANSTIYNDFVRPSGDDSFHACGVGISSPWGAGIIGIHRSRGAAAFEDVDVTGLKPLLRDLGRVLRARTELASARRQLSISTAAQDHVGIATVVAGADGNVLQINAAAEAVLRRGDGLCLKDGAITALRHNGASRISQSLVRAAGAGVRVSSTVVIEREAGQAPYLITVTPLVGGTGRARALLLFRDPDAEDDSLVPRLRTLFGLSNVEAVIAADVAAGFSAAEIARKRGVRASTVKTQLKSIMAKIGCRRQSEIAATVAGLPPLRA
jgi:DNA-binding CsgD family transcriptional regulator